MGKMEKIVNLISHTQEVPESLGSLHLSSIFGVILISVALCVLFSDANSKTFRLIIGILFFIMLVGEVIKQTICPLVIVDGEIVREYAWDSFPFQLCSTPLYILPLVAFLPECKLRDAAAAYIMTVGFIGGAAVYATPFTVFSENTFSNIHTMVHHGIQIVSGLYVATYYRRRMGLNFYLGSMAIFSMMLGIASYFNTVFYDMLVRTGRIEEGYSFNMFYISPRVGMHSPFFEEWLNSFPPIVYILMYAGVIASISAVLVYLVKFIRMLVIYIRSSREAAEPELAGVDTTQTV